MYIKEINLKDFRNYESLNLKFHEKVNIFLGDNAQGKTNLLEAIYFCSIGKSFRTSIDNEMIRFGEEFSRIKVLSEKDEEELTIEIVITEKNKGIKVDGVKLKKTSELLENIYTVIFSPEDLKIVKEDPEKRRKFINTELCQISPSYHSALSGYKRILKQRNTFLKDGKISGKGIDGQILEIWDEQLSSYGAEIMMKRRDFIENLKKISRELHKNITDGKENLDIVYESNVDLKEDFNSQKEEIKKALESHRFIDERNGNTSKGPHRDDIGIIVNDVDIRKFGSQGQQRTAALSLKLAELKLIKEETGENAILLLDDVMSELDASRQNFLINSLDEVQLFITTTDLGEDVKKALPKGYTFYVKEGSMKKGE